MEIFVFRRPDGSEWADYRLPEDAKVLRHLKADSQTAMHILATTETGRVRALAERALKEARITLAARTPDTPPEREVRERNLFGRLKWALFRK